MCSDKHKEKKKKENLNLSSYFLFHQNPIVNYLQPKNLIFIMKKKFSSSEGEELIGEFLEEKGIKFEPEKKVPNLKEDYADYRVADFYLPEYKTYIEFFGRWNIEKNKVKYQKKKEIYEKNNIPCVYLYPDNLGILEFIFRKRIRNVLKKHPELKFQRFKYNLNILIEKHSLELIVIGLLIYFIKDIKAKIIFSAIFIYALYSGIKSTFFK